VSFDVSLEQLLPTLIAGASLVIWRVDLENTTDFYRKITECKITILSLPTAYFQELARDWADRSAQDSACQPRLVSVGGDTLSPDAVLLWHRTPLKSIRLINAYGPTEATITATSFDVTPQLGETAQLERVPIGRPLANRTTYILDKYGSPVPVGVPGELYIGGAGLARGYLKQPDQTAEKFVPDPFSRQPGARLYRSGDRARYLFDGNLEFLGRIDDQVKLRGFRIEPGEIEGALRQHPAVRDAVVMVREDPLSEKRLVAYAVVERASVTATELRRFLTDKVPEYMVPAVFVMVDALPLMANGKIDRHALPVPEQTRADSEKTYVAPRDDLELRLTQIWQEVLSVEAVGVTDNFFELGGHSLLAVRLFSEIESRLEKKLPLAALFQGPTIEQLARVLRQDLKTATFSALVPIQPAGSKRPLFLVHPAGGLVFPYVHLAKCLGPDQPCYGLQAKGLETGEEPHTRIEDMATAYIDALRTVQPDGPYLLGGWSMGGVVAFEMAQQLQAQGQKVALLALLDSRIPAPDDKYSDDTFEATLLADVVLYFGLKLDPDAISQFPKDQLLTYILEQAKQAGLVPSELDASTAKRFVELLKSDFRATRNYAMSLYPGRVTLLKASEEPSGKSSDTTLGWSSWVAGGVEVIVVPGNHASMVYQPYVEVLANKLSACISQVQVAAIQAGEIDSPMSWQVAE
jgi:thioesterase domain-containing protein/acyl carrier protein